MGSDVQQAVKPGRLLSLDAFRGMTIAGMILVNNAGDWNHIFPPLGHASWHGCTATDLIFPFFLFIMGVAMTFSFARRVAEPDPANPGPSLSRFAVVTALQVGLWIVSFWLVMRFGPEMKQAQLAGVLARPDLWLQFVPLVVITLSFFFPLADPLGRKALYVQIARRTLLLIALGMMITSLAFVAAPWIAHPRYVGVLQRIGVCYLIVSILALHTGWRTQLGAAVALLVGYWAMMKFLPVPGFGRGVLEPSGNLAGFIDHHILGSSCYELDEKTGLYRDPEGLLSTLPALATTLSGLLTGHWLRRKDIDGNQKVAGMAVAGLVLHILGALWKYDFPYNKNLWTSSYVLHTSGWALMTLAACYWVADVKGRTGWTKPFLVYGTNPIAAYFGASMMAYSTIWIKLHMADGSWVFLKSWVYSNLYKSWIPQTGWGPYVSSAAYGSTYVAVWLGLMWILYRRRIFVKV